MLGKTSSTILRLLQLLFAACVLGLSINAVRWQYYHRAPATNGYAAFVGAYGCLTALLGLHALHSTSIAGYLVIGWDLMAALFFFVGGVAMAIGLHGTNCNNGNVYATWENPLISGGCVLRQQLDRYQCGFFAISDVEHRCRLARADMVLLWVGWVASLMAAGFSMHRARKDKKDAAPVVAAA